MVVIFLCKKLDLEFVKIISLLNWELEPIIFLSSRLKNYLSKTDFRQRDFL